MSTIADFWEKAKQILRIFGRILGLGIGAANLYYILWLLNYKWKQSRKSLPWLPGPTPLPVIGNLGVAAAKFGSDGNPLVHIGLMNEGKNYKGIYGLWLGSGYTVIITKPQVAEEAFCTHRLSNGEQGRGLLTLDRASNQSHGGHHVPSMYIMTRDGQGIAMSTGDYWRKVRGRLINNMTSTKAAEGNKDVVLEEVQSVVSGWRTKINRGERIDNLRAELKRESMNMGLRVLMSKRFGQNPPQDFKDLLFCVEFFFKNLSSGNPSDMIPTLRIFPNNLLKQFEETAQLRDKVLERLIKERLESFKELQTTGKMNSREDSRDVCDLFLWDHLEGFDAKGKDGKLERQYLTEDQVHVCMWDTIFASTDTTAASNEWLIFWLVNNPHCLARIHAELDEAIGPDCLPTLEDRPNLPYLWACIKETWRIRMVSPVNAPRYAVEDITLHDVEGKEYFIPQGAAFFLHTYSMGQDPDLWDDPLKFNPDRWFQDRNKHIDLVGQVKRENVEDYKFAPFSIGPRMCPGYSFAKVAQFLQAATILHCFKFKLAKDARKIAPDMVKDGKLDMTEIWGLSIMPQNYGAMGLIDAELRPAAYLAKPQVGDLNFSNTFLRRDERRSLKLVKKEPLSADTALMRFALPSNDMVLGLPVGKHFKIFMPNLEGSDCGKWNGHNDPESGKHEVMRSYTPTSSDLDAGYVDLVIKFYRPGEKIRFPDGGKVSQQLDKLFVGDTIQIQGPFGRIEYKYKSVFKIGQRTVTKKMVGMLAGGSGITPMLQVLMAALGDDQDETMFSLIYANQTEADILVRDKLEALERAHPERFKLHYTVDRAPKEGWKYSEGFITEEMIRKHMPPMCDDALILMCGPPPMVEFACRPNLTKIGFPKDIQVEF